MACVWRTCEPGGCCASEIEAMLPESAGTWLTCWFTSSSPFALLGTPGVAAADMLRFKFVTVSGIGVVAIFLSVDCALARACPVSSLWRRSESLSIEPPAGVDADAGVPTLNFNLVGSLTVSLSLFGPKPSLLIWSSNQSCFHCQPVHNLR